MKVLYKILAVIVDLVPPAVFVTFFIIKDITPTELGLAIIGILAGAMGILYLAFAAKPEHKMQYMCATIGLVIVCMSSMALVLGLVLAITPLAFEGGRLLWNLGKSKPTLPAGTTK